MSRDDICIKIKFELNLLETELDETSQLFEKIKISTPDNIELRAVASTLHSFYNGIEKIFVIISKDIDIVILTNERWHKSLLSRMTSPAAGRERVISDKLSADLEKYLSFRHYYRHAYGFTLDWDQIKPLCDDIEIIFCRLKDEMHAFIDLLNTHLD